MTRLSHFTVLLVSLSALGTLTALRAAEESAQPFGAQNPRLDFLATGSWWTKKPGNRNAPPSLDVPRDQVIAFALYTQDGGTVKLSAQLYPLRPEETKEARLELWKQNKWELAATAPVLYPGWSAHFRLEKWDSSQDMKYRVRHGEKAQFEGLIRKDPRDQEEISIANLSCNSSSTTGPRDEIVANLKHLNPDLLFFAGDQTYRHTEHTAGWIEFGLQFREVMRDRPTITIPDDHDVGQPNLWGENGKLSTLKGNADGGYLFPAEYVNMVERQQTWHLPDPADARPVERGIGVYFTRLRLGGLDFAILEDRKFKSGPAGKIPQMGPRPDHINDPKYDPKSIDLPGLQMLGERQIQFLQTWGTDWQGAEIKLVLSQTAFCGAVHMHGGADQRLLADMDSNGWPQSGRQAALRELRKVNALHLCGDQHLGVVVKHGIDSFGDASYAFTSPALVNTVYGRWWHPLDEKAGPNPVPDSPLPWTGDFLDGFGNRISMLAYANPKDVRDEKQRGDGFGLVRIHKKKRTARIECWPRFADAKQGQIAMFPGWPLTVELDKNDGRKATAYLPAMEFPHLPHPVIQVIEQKTGEVLYTRRFTTNKLTLPVFAPGAYVVKYGENKPEASQIVQADATGTLRLE